MRWPFSKTDNRAAASLNASDAVVQAILRDAQGRVAASAEAFAVVELCSGLWERAFATLTIEPMGTATRSLTPALLGVIGRTLALRGELISRIDIASGAVTLTPATSHDVRGQADPSTWVYRCDFNGPSRSASRLLAGEALVHFKIGVDNSRPWRGRSPLARSYATALLVEEIDSALSREAKIPVGRLISFPGTGDQTGEISDLLGQGGLTVISSKSGGWEQNQSSKLNPQAYGPDPSATLEAVRSKIGIAILGAFGVPPSLFDPTSAGPAQLASVRRFWASTIAPMALMLESEIRAKLDGAVSIGVPQLRQADEDAQSRAVQRRASALKTFLDAEIERGEAMRLAGLGENGGNSL